MGYVSEVGLCLNSTGVNLLEKALASEANHQEIMDFINCATTLNHAETNCRLYYWECIKWYLDYKHVSFIDKFITNLACENYIFIRIGEDNDDLITYGCFWENPFAMNLIRKIEFNS